MIDKRFDDNKDIEEKEKTQKNSSNENDIKWPSAQSDTKIVKII